MRLMGEMAHGGFGLARNGKTALFWYRKSAGGGEPGSDAAAGGSLRFRFAGIGRRSGTGETLAGKSGESGKRGTAFAGARGFLRALGDASGRGLAERRFGKVVFVGHGFQPDGGACFRVGFDGDVREGGVGRGAVPVFGAGSDFHDVAGLQADDGFAAFDSGRRRRCTAGSGRPDGCASGCGSLLQR